MSHLDAVSSLILQFDVAPAATKVERFGKWHECIIPIGDDHVALLTLDNDAFDALVKHYQEPLVQTALKAKDNGG